MSFTVKFLRELFSFPGQADDQEVDVFLGDANGGGVSIGHISPPGPELGTNLAMSVALPTGYFITTANPQKISAPRFLSSVDIREEFHNKWLLVELPHGVDFGKFVSDGHDSGTFYDAAGNVLKEWPRWFPLPDGAAPDPRLTTTLPEPSDAPLTVTILRPVSDASALNSMLMFALAKADGFVLASPEQPEWSMYEKRASTALEALRSVDQLRSMFPSPV